jgi:serine/threonine protein kinase
MKYRKIGRYEILDIIGQGSMGVVYKCVDTVLDRHVALKTMNLGNTSDASIKERFYREGKTLGELQHKNIVSVYELNEFSNLCYIVMELLEGQSLDKLISLKDKLSKVAKLEILRQICNGVNFAHSKGVIHRDLKPANIFLREDGVVKILDFGVAKLSTSNMTHSGVVLGTISYMAPEQLMGEEIDERADVFSIGTIMYELFSHNKPFDGDSITEIMGKLINTKPGEIKGLDKSINMIISKALEKDRDKRYSSAKEMMVHIEQILGLEKKKHTKSKTMIDKTITSRIQDVKKQLKKIEKIKEEIKERLSKAKVYMKHGSFENAIDECKAILKLDNVHKDAEIIMEQAKKMQKIKQEEEIHKQKWVKEKLIEAQQRLEEKKIILACELCESILKVDKQNNDAKVIKSVCIKKLKDFLEKYEKTNHL